MCRISGDSRDLGFTHGCYLMTLRYLKVSLKSFYFSVFRRCYRCHDYFLSVYPMILWNSFCHANLDLISNISFLMLHAPMSCRSKPRGQCLEKSSRILPRELGTQLLEDPWEEVAALLKKPRRYL